MPQIIKYLFISAILIIDLSLVLVPAQDLSIAASPAKCYAEKSGNIQVVFSKGIAPYLFILSSDSLRNSEIKRSPVLKENSYSFKEIRAGRYYVTTICGDGQVYSKIAVIDQPSQLRPGKITVESYPEASAMNGIIAANPVGGTPPYAFQWQGTGTKGTNNKITGVGNGIYKCNITDSHGCGPVSATIFLQSKAASESTSYFHDEQYRKSNFNENTIPYINS